MQHYKSVPAVVRFGPARLTHRYTRQTDRHTDRQLLTGQVTYDYYKLNQLRQNPFSRKIQIAVSKPFHIIS